jgi:hypothetical protein
MIRAVAIVLISAALLVAALPFMAVAVEIFSIFVRPISFSFRLGRQ